MNHTFDDPAPPPGAVSLVVPARADFVGCLRTLVAGVGSRLDLSLDDIDDLCLAVDEACAYLLDAANDGARMSLSVLPSNGGVDVVASLEAPEARVPPADARQTLIWHVLGAVTDGATLEHTDRGPSIRFSKRVGA